MADSKLADLTAITTPATTDILYLVHDPAGTPVDRKVTVADLRGAAVLDPLYTAPSGLHALSDEFSDGSLRADWVNVDYGNATAVTWTESADLAALSLKLKGGDANSGYHAKMLPLGGLTAPVEIETAVIINSPSGASTFFPASLVFADGATAAAGNQVALTIANSQGVFHTDLRRWTGYNAYGADLVTSYESWCRPMHIVWIRLAWVSANTWRARISFDGVSWLPINMNATLADSSYTMTPTHMGLWASTYGSGANVGAFFTFHHFRVRQSATS